MIRQLEALIETSAWQEILRFLDICIEDARVSMEVAKDFEKVCELRGSIKAFRYCKDIPEILIDMLAKTETSEEKDNVD